MKLYVAAVALVGCAGSSSSPVKGHFSKRYPDGTTVPVDLSQNLYQVYVENDGGFDRYPATPVAGTADGTFEIEGVPDGPFWVKLNGSHPTFHLRDQHDYEVTSDVLGRADAVSPSAPTPLMLDATNAIAWSSSDEFYVDDFDNATEAVKTFTAGDSELQGQIDWLTDAHSYASSSRSYLMNAGDHVAISRLSRLQDTGTMALTQVLMAPAPAQVSGQPAEIAGAFVNVPRGEALAINVDSTHFAPHQPVASAGWHLTGIVGPGTARRIAMGPLLFDIGGGPTEPTSSILYGNPFDPSWTPRLYADYVATSTYPDALFDYLVASEDRPLAAGTFTFEPLAQPAALTLQGSPIGGMVEASPRAALQVDGTVADGTSSVSVAVWHVWRDTEGFHIDDVAYLVGDRLPFAVPAEVFQSGEKYVFEVTAYASDGDRNQTSTALSDEITFVAK